MSDTALSEKISELPLAIVGVMAVLAFVLFVAAVILQARIWSARRDLRIAEEELTDPDTGLLPSSAISVRLGAELQWAAQAGQTLGFAVMRIRGAKFIRAARTLRAEMRSEEQAFLLGQQYVGVQLWGANQATGAEAVQRLGSSLAAAGHPVIDVGLAIAPRDGSEPYELIVEAINDMRPIDDPIEPGSDVGRDGRLRSAFSRSIALLISVLPWFFAQLLLIATIWRLLPAAIEPALAEAARSAEQLIVAGVAAIGIPLASVLLHASAWNLGGGRVPRSHPHGRATITDLLAIAVLIAVPLAVAVYLPNSWSEFTSATFGAALASTALLIVAILHARQLIHARIPIQLLLILIGAGVTYGALILDDPFPVVANIGRLLFAASLGAMLARQIERAWWLVLLALIAGAADLWSVLTQGGLSNALVEAENPISLGAVSLVELLFVTGPIIDGHPIFEIGVTDFTFLAVFLAWSHDWRIDMRIVTVGMIVAIWGALTYAVVTDEIVPVLPALSAMMILIIVVRWFVLTARARRWRRSEVRFPLKG